MQVERPGSGRTRRPRSSARARARSGRRSRARTIAVWSPCWSSTRRSRPSSWPRAGWSSSSTARRRATVRQLGVRSSSARTPGQHARCGPGARRAHQGDAARRRLLRRAGRRAARVRRGCRSGEHEHGTRSGVRRARPDDERARATRQRRPTTRAQRRLLKMSELAQRSGVSPGTIRYYLREGCLGRGADIVRTSRNMAYTRRTTSSG